MYRSLAIGVAFMIVAPGLVGAQGSSGQYVVTQPRHKGKQVNRIEAFTIKQKVTESTGSETLKSLQLQKTARQLQSTTLQSNAARKKDQTTKSVIRNAQ
jgi:hypothetical protein